ncbi:unnamed protein product [Peniophora sp. CBMAI 1063]|nr:unnamed protein product [Peniophora sp. CBMAI 1063]
MRRQLRGLSFYTPLISRGRVSALPGPRLPRESLNSHDGAPKGAARARARPASHPPCPFPSSGFISTLGVNEQITRADMRDLVESFDALALAGKSRSPPAPPPKERKPSYPPNGIYAQMPQPQPQGSYPYPTHSTPFIGGFAATMPTTPRPRPASGPPATTQHGLPPLPRPPSMPRPSPQSGPSLTMQHALGSPSPHRPHLAPPLPTHIQRPNSDSAVPTTTDVIDLTGSPSTPIKSKKHTAQTPQPPKLARPIHKRANSEPPSPVVVVGSPGKNKDGDAVQCAGMTAAGARCRKMVKTASGVDGDVFCHQHEKKMREPSGFYDRKTGKTFVKFGDWIPDHLQPSTQASLRSEMQKARSDSDVDGYIYTFEILDPSTPSIVHLKVGRATNLNRRMDQWSKQCGSHEQVLRGHWPGGMTPDQASLVRGLIVAGDKGKWCHRLERLVHLELADLAAYAPYLDSGFPSNMSASDDDDGGAKGKKAKRDVKKCPDCGKMHKEIFTFERAKGRYDDREWELIVKPVIEKWGMFVEHFL